MAQTHQGVKPIDPDILKFQLENEENTKRSLITPVLEQRWPGKDRIVMEYFTDGRITVDEYGTAHRGKPKKVDYLLLYFQNIPLALVEAKGRDHTADEGYAQAIEYARILDVPFAYATNGVDLIEKDMVSGLNREMKMVDFPGPDELWGRYVSETHLESDEERVYTYPYYVTPSGKTPRYYQRIIINRTTRAVLDGKKRILIVCATGTGKTFEAFQLIWRFWKSGLKKKILFLADRNILVDQTMREDFAPFEEHMVKFDNSRMDTAHEIYLGIYQQFMTTRDGEVVRHYKKYPRDFFDLVIVDECHRSSADRDSSWHDILDYFGVATIIGLTATPKDDEDPNRSNIAYFGEPIYTYSLKQGIDDGFLAPYKVVVPELDIDKTGYTPEEGAVDDEGEPIEVKTYYQRDFDRAIVLPDRRRLVAKRITEYLKINDMRYSKTIVFCETVSHAHEMVRLLENENADLVAEDARYVMAITGEDAQGKAELKVSPIATRLRASILQQAVEGRLVPQNPAEGTADELLEQIREQRAELVKQKKAKAPKGGESRIYQSVDGSWYEQRGKGEPKCIDEEIPFDIPESWAWARLGTITSYVQRGKSPKYSTIERYPVVAQKCNQWSGFSLEKAKFIDPETLDSYGPERFLIDGDLLWNSTGLGTLGRLAVYSSEVNPYECAVADSHVTVIRTMPLWMNYQYLFYYFAGPSVQSVIEKKASGTTKQKELALATVLTYPVPVPPLAEQERIVSRIDEVMPLVDELEIRERASDAVDSAFWRKLPQSILQEAVQGRLVPQDDADEPADVLLERIRKQRAELVRQKRAKAPKGGESRIYQGADGSWYEQRGKGEPKCIDEEIPFDIPESWAWVRLGNACVLERGSGIKRGEVTPEGLPCVRYGELYTTYKHEIREVASKTTEEIFNASHKLLPDEVLITLTGENNVDIGRAVVNTTGETLAYGGDLAALKYHGQYGRFLMFLINSAYVGSLRTKTSTGDTIVHLSAKKAEEFIVPVPPLTEQRRIVRQMQKLDSLIGMRR